MSATTQFDAMFSILKGITDSANALSSKIASASANESDALAAVLNTSTDEEIVAFRAKFAKGTEQIAAAQEKLDALQAAVTAHAKTLLSADTLNVEDAKKEFMQKRTEATQLRKTALVLLGNDQQALASKIEEFGITEVNGIRGNSKVTGSTGIRRPRLSAAYVGDKSVEDEKGKVSFTLLAKELGADLNALRAAAYVAAGTEDLTTKPGETFDFPLTVGDKTSQVSITLKAKDEPATESDSSDSSNDHL